MTVCLVFFYQIENTILSFFNISFNNQMIMNNSILYKGTLLSKTTTTTKSLEPPDCKFAI